MAVASLVLGITGWMLCGIGSIVGLVLGFVALGQIRNSGGRQTGAGMAKWGIGLGAASIALMVVYIVAVAIVSGSSST
jgi:hypothetical protein